MSPPRLCAAVTAIALLAAPGLARAAPLSEDFESPGGPWEVTGLWHVQDRPDSVAVSADIGGALTSIPPGAALPAAFNGTGAAWFGDPATGTYCVGFAAIAQHPSDGCRSNGPVEGTLTSPPFAVPHAPATLTFQAWWEIAGGKSDAADLMSADYSTDGGTSWTTGLRLNPVTPPFGSLHQPRTAAGLRQPAEWRSYAVDLAPAVGQSNVRVRFRFDSVDSLGQGFRGLLVDAVRVEGSERPNASSGPVAEVGTPGGGIPVQPPGRAPGAVLGAAVILAPVSGRSTYTVPGTREPRRLLRRTVVPIRTVVDSRRGVVRVTTATATPGVTQSGSFHDGVFQIRQDEGADLVELALRGGSFPHCDTGCTSVVRDLPIRRLWGNCRGHFRTRGRYGAASVRGTSWLVEDRAGDTLIKVRRGSTLVRDFIRDRDVVLEEGETYVARVVYTNRQRGNARFGQQYTIRVRGGRVVHVYETQRVTVGR
jgi:hypothetical protein